MWLFMFTSSMLFTSHLVLSLLSLQPKVMRVLNLWQKNEVFPTEVIQKLMALAPNPGKHFNVTVSVRKELLAHTTLLGL